MSSSKTINITSGALVLIVTCKAVLAEYRTKLKSEIFIVTAVSILDSL